MTEKITDLSAEDAKAFFLDARCYCTIDLPKYFDFSTLLKKLSSKMKGKTLEDIALKEEDDSKKNNKKQQIKYPSQFDKVNYIIYQNKDGNFAWRKTQLLHPAIYICLVNLLTEENNWNVLRQHFKKCTYDDRLKCCSSLFDTTNKADNVMNWWEFVEQKSIELSMDYNWLAVTDITDCYGSLYTHSISWAIHGKERCKTSLLLDKPEKLFGNDIDIAIRQMTYNQTNGIPQCSDLMDFIAEIVLAYADRILLWKIYRAKITEFQILRYRDDYRIFTKSKEDVVIILRLLSEVLADLNFKLNPSKTFISQELIIDSIKPDKLYWNESKQEETTLQKHLLLIHKLAKEYTNSGSIVKALTTFMERIDPIKTKIQNENIGILIAILADIATHNPKVYPLVATIIAKLTAFEAKDDRIKTFNRVMNKLKPLPNAGLLLLWIQRMMIKSGIKIPEFDKEPLCEVFYSRNNKGIWNNEWLREPYRRIIEETSIIIKKEEIDKMSEVPDDNEVKLFVHRY